MKRAAILIGVDKTGNLPKLRDAAAGARRMEAWARSQGMSPVVAITDEAGKAVEVHEIKRAIRPIVENGVDQLVIYFAGHGVNIRYSEYWLLSGAPEDPDEAVNVDGSATLARYCGIPHVVLFSDACRTAADGIQAQFVSGSLIFPNEGAGDLEKPVDQFFACMLGRPSHEVKDPDTTAREYKAIYTNALHDVLTGKEPELLDWDVDEQGSVGLVRPDKLKAFLTEEVTERLRGLQLETKVVQVPDARILSAPDAWIARIAKKDVAEKRTTRSGGRRSGRGRTAHSAASITTSLLRSALSADPAVLEVELDRSERTATGKPIVDEVRRVAAPIGPGTSPDQTKSCFRVRGAQVAEAHSKHADVKLIGDGERVVIIDALREEGASVLLILESGAGAVLPALRGFDSTLTINAGELVDVSYEPSLNDWRRPEFDRRAAEVRSLRAVVSAATLSGVLRFEGDDAGKLARKMQYAKGVDPSLAVYAAYAYRSLGRSDLIRTMGNYMQDGFRGVLFDMGLLAHELDGKTVGKTPGVFGCVPLLAQGWSLLSAHRVSLPPGLDGIERALVPSLWTLFDPDGAARIRQSIRSGEVR